MSKVIGNPVEFEPEMLMPDGKTLLTLTLTILRQVKMTVKKLILSRLFLFFVVHRKQS
jgi:hypothetical protein